MTVDTKAQPMAAGPLGFGFQSHGVPRPLALAGLNIPLRKASARSCSESSQTWHLTAVASFLSILATFYEQLGGRSDHPHALYWRRYAREQTSLSARDGTSRSDGGFIVPIGANPRGRSRPRRRVVDIQPLDPQSDYMHEVVGIQPPKPPAEMRQTYHERTGTPRLPMLARAQLVNEVRAHLLLRRQSV
eukprot:COSAG02_NODE_2594_length_8461_cov_189.802320_9_plen_189_part_00